MSSKCTKAYKRRGVSALWQNCFASKVGKSCWKQSVPPALAGGQMISIQKFLLILSLDGGPPAIAGGTDLFQAQPGTFAAKPSVFMLPGPNSGSSAGLIRRHRGSAYVHERHACCLKITTRLPAIENQSCDLNSQ